MNELEKLANRSLLYSLPLTILGAAFRLLHFAGANQMLLVVLSSVAIAGIIKYGAQKTLDGYLTGLAIAAGCAAVLFKLMHWSNADMVIKAAITVAIVWGIKTNFFPDKEKEQ